MIQKVSIVGNGNVGSHLIEAFCNAQIEVTHVLVRNKSKEEKKVNFISSFNELPLNQLVIVCVPDDHVIEVIEKIDTSCPVAYTSGSVNLSSIPTRLNIGVFYPLQTFSKHVELDLSTVPFFIESLSDNFGTKLFELAKKISSNVKYATSEDRAKLHLAGVWVNNFTNHVNYIAKAYIENENLDFEDLKPLLKETIRKIETNTPYESQTGPARRDDSKTIDRHLSMLDAKWKVIYQQLTNSIINTYKK